jgi:hypothetical protein
VSVIYGLRHWRSPSVCFCATSSVITVENHNLKSNMSEKIQTDSPRHIVEEFAKEIIQKRVSGTKPEKTVIEFRNDRADSIERRIWSVPVKLLRFRKDNGRIASDVLSYEKTYGRMDENLTKTQEKLREFLAATDVESNTKLKKLIEHSGQLEPAIITCDGFLINGNRRKMTIEALKYETMKVVILPDEGEEGGAPTIKEIEQIENRYQLQSDGKSEYTNFNRAISIKRKIDAGMSLDEQLRDDPSLIDLSPKEFKKEMQRCHDEFLGPLDCVDRYLEQHDRQDLYDNISEGRADREGRWYSFVAYHQAVYKKLKDAKARLRDFELDEDEVGKVENVAFKIIRKKDDFDQKPMEVIRTFPKILKNPEAKKELMKILQVSDTLEKGEYKHDDELRIIDKKWGNKNATIILGQVKKAIRIISHEKDRETPLTLLEDAFNKLHHEKMDPTAISPSMSGEAIKWTQDIAESAKELEREFFRIKKQWDRIPRQK